MLILTVAIDARSDDELLQAWRTGDSTAGGVLYDRHVAAVACFFRNKTPDHVEELIQQSCLDWKHAPRGVFVCRPRSDITSPSSVEVAPPVSWLVKQACA